jgi:Mrp family chromosome partitioning ATPase
MESYNSNGRAENTARDYIRVVFRRKGVIIASIVTVMATVIGGLFLKTNVYTAQVKMLVSAKKHSQADYYSDLSLAVQQSDQIALTQAEIVVSDPVIERAVSALGLAKKPFDYEKRFCSEIKKPLIDLRARRIEKKLGKLTREEKDAFLFRIAMEDLRNRLKVEPVRDTDIFLIKIRDYNPLAAAVSANIVSRSYVIFDLEQQLAEMKLKFGEKNQSVIQLYQAIERMNKSLSGAPLPHIEAIGPASVKIVEQAKVALEPDGMPKPVLLILGFCVSIFLSLLLAFTFEQMDASLKSPSDIEYYLKLKNLASLARKARVSHYRRLSEQLYLAIEQQGIKSIVFTSALPEEGASQIAVNLAAYISGDIGKKVLLMDANFRNPRLHKLFNAPQNNDFLDIIQGDIPLEKAVTQIRENLNLLRSCPCNEKAAGLIRKISGFLFRRPLQKCTAYNPVALLESKKMKDLIRRAHEAYDYLLIDASALRDAEDAAIVSSLVNGVIVVISEGRTRRHVAMHALEPLRVRKANLLGTVLNNRRYYIPGAIYKRV